MTEEKTTAPAEATSTTTPEAPKKEERGGQNDKRQRGRGGRGKGRRGRKPREPKEFEESILQIDRVTRVTRGGRQLRFRVSIVIGDGKGRVGFGIGKSSEVLGGIRKAVAQAKRNIITIPIFDETIPHQITATYKSSQVTLYPAQTGKGVIAGGATRKILDISGVKNVLSKMHGSRNRINIARATFEALSGLETAPPYKKKTVTTEENATE